MPAGPPATAGRFPTLAAAYFDGGARLVQLRAPGAASGVLEGWCDAVVARASGYGATVIVNDRADVARVSGAAGVHLGQDDLPVGDARKIVGESGVVGLSTHSADQIRDALTSPVTYVAVGPVARTETKNTGYRPVGVELVREAAGRAGATPVVAIEGHHAGTGARGACGRSRRGGPWSAICWPADGPPLACAPTSTVW